MSLKNAVLTALIVVGSVAPSSAQRAGKVTGTVLDQFNAMTLPMAPVAVVESGQVTYTDMDGKYVVELPPGSYELKVTFSGYQGHVVAVTVVSGQTISLNLAAEDMRKNADSDAAAAVAVSRVAGLSVVGGQYVFVRGLGERYSSTQLNGATLPTTAPDKKVVPLDVFPSGLTQSAQSVRGSIFTDAGFTRDELQTFGRSFSNVWEPRTKGSAVPNQSESLVWGKSTEMEWQGRYKLFSYVTD